MQKLIGLVRRCVEDYDMIRTGEQESRRYYHQMSELRREIFRSPEKEWSVEELARRMHLSVSRFQHVYKEMFMTTFHQDLIQNRMDYARLLLRNSSQSVVEIAEICGYGNTCDAYHVTAPRPEGVTQAAAIRQALDEAGYVSDDILYINAHGTGTALNDPSETAAFKIALGDDAYKAHVSSTKACTGHMLGAAGAVEAVATVLALKNGIVPPTANLDDIDPECDLDYTPNVPVEAPLTMAISDSLGFGGHNGCLAFRKYNG